MYDELDLAEIEREKNLLSKKNSGSNFMDKLVKMPDQAGFVVVRILPPRPSEKLCCRTRTHTYKSQFMESARNFHCLRNYNKDTTRWEGECPGCTYWGDLWNKIRRTPDGQELTKLKKEATDVKPVERYYLNGLVITSKPPTGQSPDDGPLILSIGKILYTKILTAITGDKHNEVAGLGNVTHPITGRNFKIIKAIKPGEEKWPDYGASTFLDPSKLGSEQQIKEWLSAMHELQSLRRLDTPEEMLRVLRIYKGKEKDRRTSFDLSDLEDGPKPVAATKLVETKVNLDEDPDLALAEDPFIKEMNSFE